jgi:hypothetical protein
MLAFGLLLALKVEIPPPKLSDVLLNCAFEINENNIAMVSKMTREGFIFFIYIVLRNYLLY